MRAIGCQVLVLGDGVVHERSEALRRADLTKLVRQLEAKTPLAPGLTRRKAADLLFVLTGPERYRSFVVTAGWSQRSWVEWVTTSTGTYSADVQGSGPAEAARLAEGDRLVT